MAGARDSRGDHDGSRTAAGSPGERTVAGSRKPRADPFRTRNPGLGRQHPATERRATRRDGDPDDRFVSGGTTANPAGTHAGRTHRPEKPHGDRCPAGDPGSQGDHGPAAFGARRARGGQFPGPRRPDAAAGTAPDLGHGALQPQCAGDAQPRLRGRQSDHVRGREGPALADRVRGLRPAAVRAGRRGLRHGRAPGCLAGRRLGRRRSAELDQPDALPGRHLGQHPDPPGGVRLPGGADGAQRGQRSRRHPDHRPGRGRLAAAAGRHGQGGQYRAAAIPIGSGADRERRRPAAAPVRCRHAAAGRPGSARLGRRPGLDLPRPDVRARPRQLC